MKPDRVQSRRVPSGRISRLYRLGVLTSGIAGNLAIDSVRSLSRGRPPGLQSLLLTPANARRLADDLSRMRGAAMKMGQLLSMEAGDLLPPELSETLSRLRAAADPMPPHQLKTVLRDAWGNDWRRSFKGFDTRPIAAASIGQVHRARLRDGRELAVKVQYPGIAESIDSDVANLGALLRLSGLLPKSFDLSPYLDAARNQLHLEADYREEARALVAYSDMLGGMEEFELPEIVGEWSTRSVLSMTYLPSRPIESLQHAPQAQRDTAMHDLLKLFLEEFFTHRMVQTDPNFANYRHSPQTGKIVLLDFGAVRQFEPQLVELIRELLAAGMRGDLAAIESGAERLGLFTYQTPAAFRKSVLDMIEMVFAELRGDIFDFQGSELLSRLREAGRALTKEDAPPPSVPIDLLYLQRKAGGMFLLATRLGARVRIAELLAPYIEGHEGSDELSKVQDL